MCQWRKHVCCVRQACAVACNGLQDQLKMSGPCDRAAALRLSFTSAV